MSGRIDRTGQRFGRLVVSRLVEVGKNWVGVWECVCDCGQVVKVRSSNLTSGQIKSCGCLKREATIRRNTSHGLSGGEKTPTKLYRIWLGMRRRCFSVRSDDYPHYGGRGITVCGEWADYAAFHAWAMASGYQSGRSIERNDVDGNYEPSNCRWATRREQALNKRNSRRITYNGQTLTTAEWAEATGIPHTALRMRLHRGWSVEKALTEPVEAKSKSKEAV